MYKFICIQIQIIWIISIFNGLIDFEKFHGSF